MTILSMTSFPSFDDETDWWRIAGSCDVAPPVVTVEAGVSHNAGPVVTAEAESLPSLSRSDTYEKDSATNIDTESLPPLLGSDSSFFYASLEDLLSLPLEDQVNSQNQHSTKHSSILMSGSTDPQQGTQENNEGEEIKRKVEQQKDCTNPDTLDVLLGRGGFTNQYPGNVRFREVARNEFYAKYKGASKMEKKLYSQGLVDAVRNWGGRFLEKNKSNGRSWYKVVNNERARHKASQVLREAGMDRDDRRRKRDKYRGSRKR